MLPLSVRQLTDIVQGTQLQGHLKGTVTGVAIDSRAIRPGDLFVAFVGTEADGHNFVGSAFERGAVAALVTKHIDGMDPCVNLIRVADPLVAVQRLAVFERTRFGGPVIGVTGSNGKTTTKDMLAAVFSAKGPCLATTANYNNELGMPLTLLGRTEEHQSIVLEMGMRGLGQIAKLASIAQPTAGMITNIGQSHIELLGSQQAIAEAKGELLEALPKSGVAVLNRDDPWLVQIAGKTRARVLWYQLDAPTTTAAAAIASTTVAADARPEGISAESRPVPRDKVDAYASDLVSGQSGVTFTAHVLGDSVHVTLPAHGRHNVANALGALLLGAAHAIPLKAMADALANVRISNGRFQLQTGKNGTHVIDDTYNASPLSTKASLSALRDLAEERPTVAILGDMYELGDTTESGHREVGAYVAELGIDSLFAIGPYSKWTAEAARQAGHTQVHWFEDKESALKAIPDLLPEPAVILVKASRGMQLEDVVRALV
ncbi:UDP-N-acetylmuramoyl-tripeptide--D-alanyl-D-alanine ligase [Alicyclobacillus sp. ALC3]|uniref:UDP-N-acetylmuramoyl-tripeptide--D-alanyl-D- alanine ligase n=1 Tax=Alicyclobacillus sp. ALC3 TaxID=2796143 RepID=UPI0023792302|nr:UDP-N-acetylmuramoyl-tripeptide--D-alanyl-D-alanine ligase [Alicyclobacillus sp. ALC3]WDL98752.1 UDP-N-acetylmuramoyl-tripeptide--D-alanyl-D-alanine ligase [Alicyclobacillus sp. ALC3]